MFCLILFLIIIVRDPTFDCECFVMLKDFLMTAYAHDADTDVTMLCCQQQLVSASADLHAAAAAVTLDDPAACRLYGNHVEVGRSKSLGYQGDQAANAVTTTSCNSSNLNSTSDTTTTTAATASAAITDTTLELPTADANNCVTNNDHLVTSADVFLAPQGVDGVADALPRQRHHHHHHHHHHHAHQQQQPSERRASSSDSSDHWSFDTPTSPANQVRAFV